MSSISDRADISRVLMQMRDVRSQVQPPGLTGVAADVGTPQVDSLQPMQGTDKSGFGQMLKEAVSAVNETQMKAGEMQQAYELGDDNVDLTQVMIQMQKASVSFEAMTQVRNRLVSAYQDIMNMPI